MMGFKEFTVVASDTKTFLTIENGFFINMHGTNVFQYFVCNWGLKAEPCIGKSGVRVLNTNRRAIPKQYSVPF
jgi:hypothetical protein